MEGNDLTENGKDYSGVEEMAHALESNEVLLQLNLCNTNLTKECGELLKKMLNINKTLILLDIDQNPNLPLEDVRLIQKSLERNKKDYDDERYKEFIERKKMWNE